MDVKSREKKENSTVELVIEVGAEAFEAALNKVYLKKRGSINIPGFRKGKAPRKLIESMYGTGVFYEDAVNELYPAAYAEAVEQEGLDAVAYPSIEIMEMGKEGFTFKATVTVKPEATLGQYKGLSAVKLPVEVTDADIEGELRPLIERATRLITADRAARTGDTVVIDFEGFESGVPFAGGKAEGHSLELGSGAFIPGFEEQLEGKSAGDELEVNVTFPEEYTPELAGKPVVFKVKVHEVKEKLTPVLDDEFAKDVSEFETLADLKKDLGEKLSERRTAQSKEGFERAILDQLADGLTVEVPEAMVEYRAEKIMDDYARRITAQGIPFEQYMSMMGLSPEMLRAQADEAARRQIRIDLALEAVAAAESIAVTDADVEEEFSKLAEQYGMPAEQIRAAVPEADLRQDLLTRKATAFVVEHAVEGETPAEKPAKKPAAKKAASKTKKAEETEAADEAPAKKPAAKKAAPKAKKAEETEAAAEKPAKKPAAKKAAPKAKKAEE